MNAELKQRYINDLTKIHGDKFKLVGKFKNRETKTQFKCHCGSTFEARPKDIIRKERKGCMNCYKENHSDFKVANKLTVDALLKRLNDKYKNNEFKYISGFDGMKKKCTFKHNICGNIFEAKPEVILGKKNYSECPKCATSNVAKTTEQFKQEVKELVDDEYEVLTEYISNKKKIKIKHQTCGLEYEVRPNCFLNGARCPQCVGLGMEAIGIDVFKERFYEIKTNQDFEIIKYTSSSTTLIVKHKTCGHEFEYLDARTSYRDGLGCKCPKCTPYSSESKGETFIRNFLNEHNIDFVKEKTFDGCKNINLLRFDFFIEKYNLLIEYDGIHHYKEVSYLNRGLEETQKCDNLKNEWVKDSKYTLIRIPYYSDLEKVLNSLFIQQDIDLLNEDEIIIIN